MGSSYRDDPRAAAADANGGAADGHREFDPNTGQPIVPSGFAVEDKMSKVKELKQMLDGGALTQAEFDAERKVLGGPSAHV